MPMYKTRETAHRTDSGCLTWDPRGSWKDAKDPGVSRPRTRKDSHAEPDPSSGDLLARDPRLEAASGPLPGPGLRIAGRPPAPLDERAVPGRRRGAHLAGEPARPDHREGDDAARGRSGTAGEFARVLADHAGR